MSNKLEEMLETTPEDKDIYSWATRAASTLLIASRFSEEDFVEQSAEIYNILLEVTARMPGDLMLAGVTNALTIAENAG